MRAEDVPPVHFTFNPTPEMLNKASAHKKGVLDWFRRQWESQLEKEFGKAKLPYWFALDVTKEGRLHLHGAFIPPAYKLSTLRRVRKAMKAAWGKWTGPGCSNQSRFGKLYSDGWALYAMKNHRRVAKLIGDDRTFVVTRDLQRDAQQTYNEIRRLMANPELAWWRSVSIVKG